MMHSAARSGLGAALYAIEGAASKIAILAAQSRKQLDLAEQVTHTDCAACGTGSTDTHGDHCPLANPDAKAAWRRERDRAEQAEAERSELAGRFAALEAQLITERQGRLAAEAVERRVCSQIDVYRRKARIAMARPEARPIDDMHHFAADLYGEAVQDFTRAVDPDATPMTVPKATH